MIRLNIIWYCISILFINMGSIAQQPGDLDGDFSGDGMILKDFYSQSDKIQSIVLQEDGKIVVAGSIYESAATSADFAIARYLWDGSADNSFGVNGKVMVDINSSSDYAYDIIIQPDGKFVVGGAAYVSGQYDFAIIRINIDGTLDANFGGDGKVVSVLSSKDDGIWSLALQNDGKIVAAGYAVNGFDKDFAIARYNPDGNLDATFGTMGVVSTDVGGTLDEAWSVALQPDGKLVVAGRGYSGTSTDFAIARYNIDGSLDNAFGSSGLVLTDFIGEVDEARDLVILDDGKILVAGNFEESNVRQFGLARYEADGTLDITFNFDGKVNTVIGTMGLDIPLSMTLQPDDKILLAGFSFDTNSDLALVRYTVDGLLDSEFGVNGKVVLDIDQENDYVTKVVLQSDGRILAGGYTTSNGGTYPDFALLRFLSGLNISVNDLTNNEVTSMVYPNPIGIEGTTLTYELVNDSEVSMKLSDLQGNIIEKYLTKQRLKTGHHEQHITIPANLSPGSYFIDLSTNEGKARIQVVLSH